MNNLLILIKKMHEKYNITHDEIEFSARENSFRVTAMQEELDEYIFSTKDEEKVDALIDLIIFAMGTIERLGYLDIFEDAFEAIMKSNMTKKVGKNEKRDNFELDLIKTDEWEPAVLTDLIRRK